MNVQVHKDILIKMDGRNVPATFSLTIDDPPTDVTLDEVLDALESTLAPSTERDRETNGTTATPVSRAHYLLGESWKPPQDLHGRAWKTVHRILMGVHDATQRGQAATARDVQERAQISPVPIYNAMKPDTPTGKYAAKYLLVGDQKRNRTLDLTKDGNLLVSLMRAGKVPY